MRRTFIMAAAATALLSSSALAAQGTDTQATDELQWREMVPGVVSFAPVHGDWEKGAHVKFARIEPGATVPMHTHTQPYHAVLVSGRLTNLLDSGPTKVELVPGDHWYMAGTRVHGHTCTSQEPCLFYTHSDAAWDLALVE